MGFWGRIKNIDHWEIEEGSSSQDNNLAFKRSSQYEFQNISSLFFISLGFWGY